MRTFDDEHTVLCLTPGLDCGRHVVLFGDQRILVRHAQFLTLVTLVRCLLTKPYGRATPADFGLDIAQIYKPIQRLREELDDACGPETGAKLIRSLGRRCYRLDLDPDAIAVEIGIESLAPHDLTQREVDALLRHARVCQPVVRRLSAVVAYDSVIPASSPTILEQDIPSPDSDTKAAP